MSYHMSDISRRLARDEHQVVRLTDVTDPRAAADHTCVRTLMDEFGNRYVLLTTAQYLRLLQHSHAPYTAARCDEVRPCATDDVARPSMAASEGIE